MIFITILFFIPLEERFGTLGILVDDTREGSSRNLSEKDREVLEWILIDHQIV